MDMVRVVAGGWVVVIRPYRTDGRNEAEKERKHHCNVLREIKMES